MAQLAIAMDLGTSGFRAQAIELPSGDIVSTVISARHPLPGANVMDHLHFALALGGEIVASLMVQAVNCLIIGLQVPIESVIRLALCGNPIQLSLFQGSEIRDLAYAGTRKLESLGIVPQNRDAMILEAKDFQGLSLPGKCEVIIPPAIRHEVGADALAMIIQTGMLEKNETSMVIDYGTNAEMALFYNGRVVTGSAAAGPALEGQHLTCGMLAAPGALCDLISIQSKHRTILLDSEMLPVKGPVVDLRINDVTDDRDHLSPIGITGTGTIAIINQAMEAGLLVPPRIRTGDRRLHLGEDIYLTEEDILEAGKAFGALRAGQITLCHEAGISLEHIETMYMCGASGTYVDGIKARKLGLILPRVKKIYQMGNTSLAMSRDLAVNPDIIGKMTDLATTLKGTHCMFATSQTFSKVFILEQSYWTEGMPMSLYRDLLKRYNLPDLPEVGSDPKVIQKVKSDIDDSGKFGLRTISNIGRVTTLSIDGCTSCKNCIGECPGRAISIGVKSEPGTLTLDESLCYGMACRRCEHVCPEKVFNLDDFFQVEFSPKSQRTLPLWPCSE